VVVGGLDDLDELLSVHMEAFRGTMGVSLGPGYVRTFLRRFVTDPSAFALVARRDSRLVGYALGAPIELGSSTTTFAVARSAVVALLRRPSLLVQPTLRSEVRRRIVRVVARVRRGLPGGADRRAPGPTDKDAGLQVLVPEPARSLVGIGVADQAQGTGVGRALLEAFELEARKRGDRSVRLSVYQDNDAARRLYERSGWSPTPHPENLAVLYYVKHL
jgi:ribosomal protein S18 acetylase RimI-like enzyme